MIDSTWAADCKQVRVAERTGKNFEEKREMISHQNRKHNNKQHKDNKYTEKILYQKFTIDTC